MQDALKLIIGKSPAASCMAAKTLQAIGAGSPMVQHRYNHTVALALGDQGAEFTADERALIASYLDVQDASGTRDKLVQVRVTEQEKGDLELMAEQAGFHGDVSAWTRHLWGLG